MASNVKLTKKFDLQKLDTAILTALSTRGAAETYVLWNILASWPERPFYRTGLETRHVLTACQRLCRRGHVEDAPTPYVVMKAWRLTPAGLEALREVEGR